MLIKAILSLRLVSKAGIERKEARKQRKSFFTQVHAKN